MTFIIKGIIKKIEKELALIRGDRKISKTKSFYYLIDENDAVIVELLDDHVADRRLPRRRTPRNP